MEETLEQIKTNLIEEGNLRDIIIQINSYDSSLEDLDYWENGDDFFDTFFQTKDEAVRAACYGDYTYTDEYVIINAYGNLDSIGEYEYQSLLEDSIDEIVDALLDNWDDVKDSIGTDISNETIALIEEYKNNE